jgi:D-3-phosphoglycerate dehydrogenase
MMKPNAVLVNTARGGIVNEADLCAVLQEGHLAGAAMDVFEIEPYQGCLSGIERCLLTSHMGSMSEDCRTQMEIEATQETIRFLKGQPLLGEVPEHEYKLAR